MACRLIGAKALSEPMLVIVNFPRYWSFVRGIHRSPVDSPHESQWRGALIFFLICAWTKGCANNRDAGDWRCHRGHYNVTVMVNGMISSSIPGATKYTVKPRISEHARWPDDLIHICESSRYGNQHRKVHLQFVYRPGQQESPVVFQLRYTGKIICPFIISTSYFWDN